MINIPPVGSTILVTFPTKPYNQELTMKVIADDIKDDSFGNIKLHVLKDEMIDNHEVHSFEWYTVPRYPNVIGDTRTRRQIEYHYNEDGSKKMVKSTHRQTKPCVDRFSIVEPLWFDEELTGRKVTILN